MDDTKHSAGLIGSRPRVHFTTATGWLNDPHGITWFADQYHLFYQCVPGVTTGSPHAHWGHATSTDLLSWTEQPIALAPSTSEIGCWSGTSVVTDGELVLYYTRVAGDNLQLGQVVRARSDTTSTWAADPWEPVATAPTGALHFRDPCIIQADGRWTMLVGMGLSSGRPAIAQYTSTDLLDWDYVGLLCQGDALSAPQAHIGSVWECPQFFTLDGHSVLLVSLWDNDMLHHVMAAVGEYDGVRFTPRRWQQVTFGSSLYAMTTFQDRTGARCVSAWLREGPSFEPAAAARAGAHSLPYQLGIDQEERLTFRVHPDLAALTGERVDSQWQGSVSHYTFSGPGRLDVHVPPRTATDIRIASAGGPLLTLRVAGDGSASVVHVGSPLKHPAGSANGSVTLVVDGDIVEVCLGSNLAAYRMPRYLGSYDISLTQASADGTPRRAQAKAHQLSPALPPPTT